MNEMPKQIICEGTLFTLGAIDENGDGYYLGEDGGFIRANDLYVDEEILDENGIPHYDEYAVNGLYFAFDDYGYLDADILVLLQSIKCQILTNEMRRFINLHTFIYDLEIGWDYAITELQYQAENDISLLCNIYCQGYHTTEYKDTADPDSGLCYEIRQFAIQKILEVLKND